MERTLGPHFLRAWRKAKKMTLEKVAPEVGIHRTQLGRIERCEQPYNQELLEKLATLYGRTVLDLLSRDPKDGYNVWSLWDRATAAQREQITAHAETVIRTMSDD